MADIITEPTYEDRAPFQGVDLRVIDGEGGEYTNPHEVARYDVDVQGSQFTVVIADSGDPRAAAGREIEVDTFARLGDDPDEVREEFEDYEADSLYIFVHATNDTAEATDQSALMGMGRLIPHTDELGLKTFNDLGEIAALTPQYEVRAKILGAIGLTECLDDPSLAQCSIESITARIEQRFRQEFGVTDLNKLLDIATLAPDMTLPKDEKMSVIEALLRGMALYGEGLKDEGKLTHYIQFTEKRFHDLLEGYGFPVQKLLGLEGIVYDSFGNGSGDQQNMVATPSVLSTEDLSELYWSERVDSLLCSGLAAAVRHHYAHSRPA